MIDQVLHKTLGTRLDFSIAFHPQIDDQSERTIQNFKDMLRMCNGFWWSMGHTFAID